MRPTARVIKNNIQSFLFTKKDRTTHWSERCYKNWRLRALYFVMGPNTKNHCFHLSRWVATLVRDGTWIARQTAWPAPHSEVLSPETHFYHSKKLRQQRRCKRSSNNWSQMTAVSFLSRWGPFSVSFYSGVNLVAHWSTFSNLFAQFYKE